MGSNDRGDVRISFAATFRFYGVEGVTTSDYFCLKSELSFWS